MSALDATGKIAALIAAASALIGVTYNVVFFWGSKQEWLFFLSVTDNVTATLYALPFVAVVAFVMAQSALVSWVFMQAPPSPLKVPDPWRVVISATVQLFMLGVLVAVISRLSDPLRAASFALLGYAIGYLPGVSLRLIKGKTGGGLAREMRLSLAVALLALPVFVCVGLFARSARDDILKGIKPIEVELRGGQAVQGNLVRALEGGVILARNELWLWLPRGEITRVAETVTPNPK